MELPAYLSRSHESTIFFKQNCTFAASNEQDIFLILNTCILVWGMIKKSGENQVVTGVQKRLYKYYNVGS